MNAATLSGGRSIGRRIAAGAVLGLTVVGLNSHAAGAECKSLLGCAPATTTTTVPSTTSTTVPVTPTTVALPPSRDDTADNPRLLALMNSERAANGLPLFTLRSDVTAIALPHTRNMATKHTIWHNDDYFSSANRARLGAGVMAENVAMNHSVEGAHIALMNSPHHRANLLDPRLTVVGLGITIDDRNMFYVTQDFLQPRTAAAPTPSGRSGTQPAPAPTAPAVRPRAAAPNPRPVAARPVTSPAVRPPSPVAVRSEVLAALDTNANADELAMSRPEIVQAPMHLKLNPINSASDQYTGLELVIIWVAGLLFLCSLPPTLRLGWQTAAALRISHPRGRG
jgi:uncharacterized protein YkwD